MSSESSPEANSATDNSPEPGHIVEAVGLRDALLRHLGIRPDPGGTWNPRDRRHERRNRDGSIAIVPPDDARR